ncbi:DNA phosphorothioation-associated putative methyltransferase [Plesiomonas shigelloides subsp. oncorhynchi]|nr:DNA phosphorothioation-associated putative methyltransferase [Plesiomonas shigelloides]
MRELEAHGLDVLGWDPAFLPDADKVCADIVNLGFVINVIEDHDERLDTLLDAWKLTKKILVVSVMVANESYTAKFRPYKDGVITSRNTFQKYYTQSEIKGYLERSLNEDVIAISPGIIYIFKDKIEEQKYLQCKYQRHHHWMQLSISKPNNEEETGKLFITQHKSLFDSFGVRV